MQDIHALFRFEYAIDHAIQMRLAPVEKVSEL